MAAREWKGVKKLALEEKDFVNAAAAFFNLGQMDSARYCAEVALKYQPNKNNPGLKILAARDIQQALRFIDEFIFLDDDEAKCNEMSLAIFAYQFFGQYEKATSTLIKLNNDYPEYGNYGWVNAPFQDKIKKEYPPFQQAVNNLKRKPMPDVSTMIKW
jgi:tetratricopeptide (TPR) repeat protein